MTLSEAILILKIEGYPSSLKVSRAEQALKSGPPRADHDESVAALKVVSDFLAMIYRESAELREAHKMVEWGPGSPTEYQEWDALNASYDFLEAQEAERRGSPKGPRRYLGTIVDEIFARAQIATVETWPDMMLAFESSLAIAGEPPSADLTTACIDLTLRLQAKGALASADALTTIFAKWLDYKRGTRPVGTAAKKWRIALELALVDTETLPRELRQPIAEAALTGDVASAKTQVRAYCNHQSAADNEERLDVLAEDAPAIATALENALKGQE